MTATAMPAAPRARGPIREFGSAVATIMAKELRSRMRGRRSFVVLTLYLGLLAFIAYGVYAVVAPRAREAAVADFGIAQANASALVGQSIFAVLAVLQVVLVSVIAPAFTAGQISQEREKQTLDLLISTPLRPGAIVIGKLMTALAFVVLMIVAAIPITAIVLMYGGATIGDIVAQQVVLLATAIGFGAVGIFASALTRRTQTATVVTYCTVIGCILGSAMLFGFWTAIAQRDDPFGLNPATAPEQIRYVNPMVAMLDIVADVDRTGGTPLTRPLYALFGEDLAPAFVGIEEPAIPRGDGGAVGGGFAFADEASNHWWPRMTITFLIAAGLLTIASMRLVVPPGMRWAWRRRRGHGNQTDGDVKGDAAIEEMEP